jgi:hypothetical protein
MSADLGKDLKYLLDRIRVLHRPNITGLILFVSFVLLVVLLRRLDQFFQPYIWSEELFILRDYLSFGFFSILEPVQGYLILSSKLLTLASFKLSFIYYPEIAAAFSVVFMICIALAIWLSPTELHNKWLCALLIFLQPNDPETFAVALYSFWWSSLLVVLAALWKNNYNLYFLKIFYIIFGGLSSPLIIGFVPIFLFRLFWDRGPREIATFLTVVVISGIQSYFILTTGSVSGGADVFSIFGLFDLLIIKFFGLYMLNFNLDYYVHFIIGFGLLSWLVYSCMALKYDRNIYIFVLAISCTILLSIYRVPIDLVHPIHAGPRYFFYPYILISWLVIYISRKSFISQKISFIVILVVLFNTAFGGGFSRSHNYQSWRGNITNCIAFDSYSFPVHTHGGGDMWHLPLNKEQCTQLVNNSLFFDHVDSTALGHIFIPLEQFDGKVSSLYPVDASGWEEDAVYGYEELVGGISGLSKYGVLGSYINGDVYIGEMELLISKEDTFSFVYTTGPRTMGQVIKIFDVEEETEQLIQEINLEVSHSAWKVAVIKNNYDGRMLKYKLVDGSDQWGEWTGYRVPNANK